MKMRKQLTFFATFFKLVNRTVTGATGQGLLPWWLLESEMSFYEPK